MTMQWKWIGMTALCLTGIGCSASDTPKWTFVPTGPQSTESATFFYDARSLRLDGDKALVNVRFPISVQSLGNRQMAQLGFAAMAEETAVMRIDCVNRMFTMTKSAARYSDGKTTFLRPDEKLLNIQENVPFDIVVDFACLPGWRRSLATLF